MFKDVGSTFGRMKHSAMVSVGKAQVTKDPEFDENYERIKVQKTVVTKMQQNCKRYLNALRSLSKAHYELAEDIRDFYLASDPTRESLKDLSVNYFASAEQLRSIDSDVEAELQQDFIAPIDIYLTEMKTTFKKIEARNRSRDDMDRLSRWANHQDPEKAAQYQRVADQFAALNSELLVELPHVFQTRTEFFDPLFKTLLEVQEKCYGKLASMEHHSAGASKVNRKSVADYRMRPEGDSMSVAASNAAAASAAAAATPTPAPGGPGYGGPPKQPPPQTPNASTTGYPPPTYGQAGRGGPTYGQPGGGAPPTYGQPGGGPPTYGQPGGGAPPTYGQPGGGAPPTYGQPGGGAPPTYGAGPPAGGGPPTYGQPGPPAGGGGPPTYGQPGGGGGSRPNLPPKVRKAKALYQFQAEEANEISFEPGDTIQILRADPGGEWWLGKKMGTTNEGLFPSAYVEEL